MKLRGKITLIRQRSALPPSPINGGRHVTVLLDHPADGYDITVGGGTQLYSRLRCGGVADGVIAYVDPHMSRITEDISGLGIGIGHAPAHRLLFPAGPGYGITEMIVYRHRKA